jgi:hypothetical protein
MPREPFFTLPPLLAVAAFVANNFVWKAQFGNALTGKLSDVLACFFLPLYVAALLGWVTARTLVWRLRLAAWLTAAVFGAVKTLPQASAWLNASLATVASWGNLTFAPNRVDPTDLVALVMIPVAVLYARWAGAAPRSDNVMRSA